MARIDLAVWREALGGMPQIKPERWHRLDIVARWLVATRAAVLIMTALSCVIAGLFAALHSQFDTLRFTLLCIGLVFAHATNNILNDVSDHQRGVDRDNAFRTRYGTQPVEEGLMTVSQARWWALWTAVPALVCGLTLSVMVGTQVLPFFVAGIVLVFGYNWPLKHYGLGEPIVVVVWGPLMVGGGYLSITGDWSWTVALASVPYALGPTTVLFGKHTDKIPWDKPRGVRTFPVLVGHAPARYLTLALIALQYALCGYLYLTEMVSWPILLVFGATPFLAQLIPVYLRETPAKAPDDFPAHVWPLWYSAYAFVHCRRFGALFVLGIAVHALMTGQ